MDDLEILNALECDRKHGLMADGCSECCANLEEAYVRLYKAAKDFSDSDDMATTTPLLRVLDEAVSMSSA